MQQQNVPTEPTRHTPTAAEVGEWLRTHLAELLGVDAAGLDAQERLSRFGLTSLRAAGLIAAFSQYLGRPLPATLVWEYPTIDALVRYAIDGARTETTPAHRPRVRESEPIAIIGMACRFPGAPDVDAYWRLLLDGVDAVTDVPAGRWDIDRYYDPAPDAPGRMSTRWGGFLEQVDQFDAGFFGLAPREVEQMDPQQRLVLELAWEALEDAGIAPRSLRDSATGVFCGAMWQDYAQLAGGHPEVISPHTATGQDLSVISARVSYLLGLQGPSLVVNTACSSALVAVHLACQSLRTGESTVALAGGVNLVIAPESTVAMSKFGAMAPDGRSKAFDARANGYVRGEGAGVVVLKPLSRALADGDPIHCVIRGSAVNNDGFSNGLTAPNPQAQVAMLRAAYEQAGVAPERVHYIETHGTGTFLGDPIEATAIGSVLGVNRPADRPLVIGSVKTNIGHLEAAAGIAGLIKTVLAIRHHTIPANLHFTQPNPHIDFDRMRLRVPVTAQPWPYPQEKPLAGVSAFGFGGTNCHVVLEGTTPHPTHLFALGAPDADTLRAAAVAVRRTLATPVDLAGLCYTASRQLADQPYRLALTARTGDELASGLDRWLDAAEPVNPVPAPSGVVFVFPGQGGQWLGMGRELLRGEPVFRRVVLECAEVFGEFVDWSLVEVLEGESVPEGIDVVQPVLFAVEVGLAALWRSWGVVPAAVVGHSMGEVAAAYVAGALSLRDAAAVICVRSGLLRRVAGRGAMAVVELAGVEVEEVVASFGGEVVVAALNGPSTTVVAGSSEAVDAVVGLLSGRGVFARRVQVDVASHSPQVEGLRDELVAGLVGLAPRVASVPLYSTVRGVVVGGGELGAGYWWENLREPVRFAPVVERLLADGLTCFLEVSPHPVLGAGLEESCRRAGGGVVLASTRRDSPERPAMLDTAAELYRLGVPLDWAALNPAPVGGVVRLPDYPWQRERHWLDVPEGATRPTTGHPLLGGHVESSLDTDVHLWTTELGVDTVPYLADHRVRDQVILPATAYVEMALAAATELLGTPARAVRDLDVVSALALPAQRPVTVQVTLTARADGGYAFRCASRQPHEPGQPADWQLHARGTVHVDHGDDQGVEPACSPADATLTDVDHYATMRARGLAYGPRFQGVRQARRADGVAYAHVRLDEPAGRYLLHPALLDSCLQVAVAALPGTDTDTYVPVAIGRIDVRDRLDGPLTCHALLQPAGDGTHLADVVVRADDPDARVLLVVTGLRLRRLASAVTADADLLYGLRWPPAPELGTPPVDADWAGRWLLFADQHTTLDAALAARGGSCVVVRPGPAYRRLGDEAYEIDPSRPEHVRDLLADAFDAHRPCRGVIHRWAVEVTDGKPDPAALELAHRLVADSVLHLVQALHDLPPAGRPRLWLVTRDSQAVVADDRVGAPWQAPLWGLGRTIGHEHPDLRCTRVDLGADLADEDGALLAVLHAPTEEPDLALRGDTVYVSRLAPLTDEPVDARPAGDRPFRVEIDQPGTLDRLALRAVTPARPGPGQVAIEVRASGLNFRDVLKTLGAYPGAEDGDVALGDECAGVVTEVGPGVTDLRVGDAVVAVAPRCLGTHVLADARLVAPKPDRLDFAEAATIPIAFLTAAYALEHLARIEPGERVLVHAAAGGVGLAAVQLVQAAGAEVFATAGSEEKRAYLASLGVTRVMDSRSTAFAGQIRAATGGRGVDVVLNSLAGDFITEGIAALAPYGRFVEIGKRDIYQDRPIGLGEFRRNLAFFAVDLDRMFTERTALVGDLLRRIVARVDAGQLRPLPTHRFPIDGFRDAFHLMEQAGHIGKIVLTVADRASVPVGPAAVGVRAEASYLVTGGLGGLGLRVARWLADAGARELVLVGRTGASEAATPVLDELTRAGVRVVTLTADVTDADEVSRVLAYVREHLAPLRGVVHAAGVLDDGILTQQTPASYRRVARAKVDAAWHLHHQTHGDALDFFVLFSSVTSVLGSPGQGSYAAGNAFLDALAHSRRAAGLPALSVNWCPWSTVGMAARLEQGGQQALRGLRAITPDQGVAVLDGLLGRNATQVVVMPFDAAEWVAAYPTAGQTNQLALLGADPTTDPTTASPRAGFLAVEPGRRRRAAMETYVREQASRVLRLAPSRIGVDTPLRNLGFDSLMSLELRNRLEAELGVALSASLLWNYPTIGALVPYLAERMGVALEAPTEPGRSGPTGPDPTEPSEPDPVTGPAAPDADLDQLTVDELEALLVQELNDLDS